MQLNHIYSLEQASIYILREAVAQAKNPVMLYSIGKDSSVMLHLARTAFYPANIPFPILHIDTGWKFQEMYKFRDQIATLYNVNLLIYHNAAGSKLGYTPFDADSAIYTQVMKTEALKQALDHYKFDIIFGGARRDEEISRAKERVFSFRNSNHQWDPKKQRPEIANLYNGHINKDETIRVFPLSDWTELDIWQYIKHEQIPIVPLYYARPRPVVKRAGGYIMVDDARFKIKPGEQIITKSVRFRTLGCYPLTSGFSSDADTLDKIIAELLLSKHSERSGRLIDREGATMELKKRDGYF